MVKEGHLVLIKGIANQEDTAIYWIYMHKCIQIHEKRTNVFKDTN